LEDVNTRRVGQLENKIFTKRLEIRA